MRTGCLYFVATAVSMTIHVTLAMPCYVHNVAIMLFPMICILHDMYVPMTMA